MRCIYTLLSVFSFFAASGQNRIIQADSKIRQVIVFLQGAQVERTSRLNLPAGRTDIVFSNVSPQLDKQSIQLKADQNITVLAVNQQVNFLKDQVSRDEIRELEEKFQDMSDKLEWEKSMLQEYKQEEIMLQKNQQIGGTGGIKTSDLKEAMDYQRMKMTEVLQKQVESAKRIKTAENALAKIRQQLTEMNQRKDVSTSEIIVQVNVPKAQETELSLSYLVHNARWNPTYDIRVKNISSPIEIVQKANISQQSGEDWKEVTLILSTGNPRERGTKPDLQPWMLGFYQPPGIMLRGVAAGVTSSSLNEVVVTGYSTTPDAAERYYPAKKASKEIPLGVETKVSYQPITTQYEIMVPYSVPNDGKEYTTEVQHHNVPAIFEYYSAPKIDPAVFLTARITNWQDLNLMPGETNLFFEGAFLGKSMLDPTTAGDTMSISLGQDKSIVIKRKLVKEFSEKKFLGNNKVDSRFYDITVKNNKNETISLILEDQFPVSTDKEIQVDQGTYKDGKLNEMGNKVTWTLALNPKEEALKQIGYKVRYPRDKIIQLD
jgi:uncharacterized protein (TIGR02231 family)